MPNNKIRARKKKLKNAYLAGVAVAGFSLNTQLDNIVRADDIDVVSQDTVLALDAETAVEVQPALIASESSEVASSSSAESTPTPATVAETSVLEPVVEEHYEGDGHDHHDHDDHDHHDHDHDHDDHDHDYDDDNLPYYKEELSENDRAIAEALSEDLQRLFTDESGNPTTPASEGGPQLAALTTENATDEWVLNGLGNWNFAKIFYDNKTGKLTLNANGQPHYYFVDRKYGGLLVERGGAAILNKELLGDGRYNFVDSGILREGDQVTVYHAEPGRMTVSNEELKKTGGSEKEFIYQVQKDLTLKNVTDLVLLQRDLSALFVDESKKGLSFGTTEDTIAALEDKVADSKYNLTAADREALNKTIAEARALLNNIAWDVPVGQTFTKEISTLPTTVIAGTEKEGRPMGTKHDRQDLGIILQEGSQIRIRQTNPDYKGKLALRLLGDDGKLENAVDFTSEWVTLNALMDVAAFVDTPITDDGIKPTVEYEIVSGAGKTLPVYTYGDSQEAFLNQWDSTKAPYALIKSYNMHLLVPILDIKAASGMDLASVITDFDTKVFPLIDGLTGIPSNTADQHIKGIYFGKANKNGVGAAYYTRTHTAVNSPSVSAYFYMSWLTIHEIAHGYEIPSNTMPIVDAFNNLYGAAYQNKYMDNPYANSWVYDGKPEDVMNRVATEVTENGSSYESLGFRDRLNLLLDLVTVRGEEGFTKFNIYHREQALAGRDIRDLGSLWAEFFYKEYNLDVTPFFDGIIVPLKDMVRNNTYRAYATPVAMLAQVVPADKLDEAYKALGWDDEFLMSKVSLITNDELAKLGYTSKVTMTIENPEEVIGTQLSIMNGDKVVKTITITDGVIDLGTLPNGVYTFKHENPKVNVEEPYLYVKEDGHTNRTVNMDNILKSLKNLYTDTNYTDLISTVQLSDIAALKAEVDQIDDETVRQENQDLIDKAYTLINQWDLKGLGNANFARVRYLNNDFNLHVDSLGGAPHSYINDTYATIEVTDPNGNVTYKKEYVGTRRDDKGSETTQLQVGSRVTIYHREGGGGRLEVYPESYKLEGETKTVYEVMPSGRLRLVGDNQTPEITTENPEVVVEVGEVLDLTSLVKAYDADDGDLTITASNIKTNLDLNKEGTYTVTYTVTDSEGATATKDITVTVVPSTKAIGQEQTVDKNTTVDPRASIANADKLPTSATYAFKDSINTSTPGSVDAVVIVTLEDGSVQEIPVTIIVRTDAEMLVPVAQDQSTAYGQAIDPTTAISNFADLPAGTQVVWGQGLDLTKPGTQEVTATVIYPDGSQEVVTVTVTVAEQAESYELAAQDQTVPYGASLDAVASVVATPSLPEGASVAWVTAPDTTKPGQQTVQVKVTFADGSTKTVDVTVTVEPQANAYQVAGRDQIVDFGAETVDLAASFVATPELPAGATATWVTAPDTSKSGQQTVSVLVTFADGSTKTVEATVVVATPIVIPEDTTEPVVVELEIPAEEPVVISLDVEKEPATVDVAPDVALEVVASGEQLTEPKTTIVEVSKAEDISVDKIEVPEGTKNVELTIIPAENAATASEEAETRLEVTVHPKDETDTTKVDVQIIVEEPVEEEITAIPDYAPEEEALPEYVFDPADFQDVLVPEEESPAEEEVPTKSELAADKPVVAEAPSTDECVPVPVTYAKSWTPSQKAAPVHVTEATTSLPNTGEESSSASLLGLGILLTGVGMTRRRRKNSF